jgi:hypothetical protein
MGQQTQATWDNRHRQHGTADTGNGTADTGNMGQQTQGNMGQQTQGNMGQQTQATWDSTHRQHVTADTGNMGQQTQQHGTTEQKHLKKTPQKLKRCNTDTANKKYMDEPRCPCKMMIKTLVVLLIVKSCRAALPRVTKVHTKYKK